MESSLHPYYDSVVNGMNDSFEDDAESRENQTPVPSTDVSDVDRLIFDCHVNQVSSLDLSWKELQILPDDLSKLSHIQYLYMEGNQLTVLPEEFFSLFPNLKWLDLRRNYLSSLPNSYLDSHRCLRTLLLEDNQLTTLPLELGLVRTLDALNLRNNDLKCPPQKIISKGTKSILSYLRRLLKAESGDQLSSSSSFARAALSNSDVSSSDEMRPTTVKSSCTSAATSSKSGGKARRRRQGPSGVASSSVADLVGDPSAVSTTSLQCLSVNQLNNGKDKRYISQSEKYLKPVDDVVGEARIQAKYAEEKRLARVRNTKMKQDEIIQGRKDQEIVKNFREETKRLQAKKLAERRLKGFVDFVEPATAAPFGVNGEDLRTVTNAERIEINGTNEKKLKQQLRPLSPETLLRLEETRVKKEQMLRDKIRQHTIEMQERRKKPYGNPVEEMKAAQKELEMALKLQKEVENRRKELEYRFTAHTVDAIDSSYSAAPPRTSKRHS